MAIVCKEKTVWCRTSFIGYHRWPEAPSDVAYLRNAHRHQFNVEVHVVVDGDNRQVEFHMLKEDVNYACATGVIKEVRLQRSTELYAPSYSCEMMAQAIGNVLLQITSHHYKLHHITVDEDGENGATIYYTEETEHVQQDC